MATIEVKSSNASAACHSALLQVLRQKMFQVGISNFTHAELIGENLYRVFVYDFYCVETLGFLQLLRHLYCKLMATKAMNYRYNPVIVTVIPDECLASVTLAHQRTD